MTGVARGVAAGRARWRARGARRCAHVDTAIGCVVVVVRGAEVERVWLPAAARTAAVQRALAGADEDSALGERVAPVLRALAEGETVPPTALPALAWERLSAFQRLVLARVAAIPRGAVASYGELARAVGRPRAARAVGRAVAANPFPLLVPCHRVVRADGTLGGFTGAAGEIKRWLLEREGALPPAASRAADGSRLELSVGRV